jgi:hypothetical protein
VNTIKKAFKWSLFLGKTCNGHQGALNPISREKNPSAQGIEAGNCATELSSYSKRNK